MNPNARPKVELVGEVSDIAGNRLKSGKDSDADDRVAPTLAVTLMEGDRPVTKDKVNLTITSDEKRRRSLGHVLQGKCPSRPATPQPRRSAAC